MMSVRAAHTLDFYWIQKRIPCSITKDFRAIEVVDSASHAIRGMVGYCNWTPNSVECHMAVDTPMAWKYLLPHVFTYPFQECGRRVIIGVIPESNKKSLSTALHLGFVEAYRIRHGWEDGVDMVLVEMRKETCKYLNKKAA